MYRNAIVDLPLRKLAISIKREIDIFDGGAKQADDIMLLALRYLGENTK
ncbi:MAG: hypothetical protein FWG02_06295 [Holophagaceae bacterium]|nr:hypothetical protein [Holophagaceae bacterium]